MFIGEFLVFVVSQGEIEVRFVSPASEAGLQTGDFCQMVESIAFFEAYRHVLEGLKKLQPGEFPLQVRLLFIISVSKIECLMF